MILPSRGRDRAAPFLAALGGITGGCSGVVVVELLCTIYSIEANPELLLEDKVECRLRMSSKGEVRCC
jgi:hypothetical protein